jgi:hypothetical protein
MTKTKHHKKGWFYQMQSEKKYLLIRILGFCVSVLLFLLVKELNYTSPKQNNYDRSFFLGILFLTAIFLCMPWKRIFNAYVWIIMYAILLSSTFLSLLFSGTILVMAFMYQTVKIYEAIIILSAQTILIVNLIAIYKIKKLSLP